MQMRLLMPVVGALALANAVCGCATQDNVVLNAQTAARRDYDQLLADYDNCVATHRSNPSACDRLKRAVEAFE
jgi:hypothetical protein